MSFWLYFPLPIKISIDENIGCFSFISEYAHKSDSFFNNFLFFLETLIGNISMLWSWVANPDFFVFGESNDYRAVSGMISKKLLLFSKYESVYSF